MWSFIDRIPLLLFGIAIFLELMTNYEMSPHLWYFCIVALPLWEFFVYQRDKYEQSHPTRTRWQFAQLALVARAVGLFIVVAASISFAWVYNQILDSAYSWLSGPILLLLIVATVFVFWLRPRVYGSDNSKHEK